MDLVAGVGAVLALYIAGRLLPAKITGKTYLKKMIWQNGIDWRSLPDSCIQEFVADALRYAKQVSSVPSNPVIPKRYFHLEFERKLTVHAAGVAAVIKGESCGDVWKDQEAVLKKYGVQVTSSRQ